MCYEFSESSGLMNSVCNIKLCAVSQKLLSSMYDFANCATSVCGRSIHKIEKTYFCIKAQICDWIYGSRSKSHIGSYEIPYTQKFSQYVIFAVFAIA